MPELPEVQAHAERLGSAYRSAVLKRFEPLAFTALKTFAPPPEAAVGEGLESVGRRGKYLIAGFGSLAFVVHLMQGGRLREDGASRKRPRGGLARWHFDDGRGWLLTEAGTEHKAGIWVVAGDPLAQVPLVELGPEATDVEAEHMAALFAAHSARLHTFLRDQRIVAGVGRRLANEICHRARLSPFAQTRKLDGADAALIVAAIRECVAEGLESERARDDMSASKERPAAVHARTGQPCPVCGEAVRAVEYRDYTVNYCANCQTGGKVLADNTTSKFLK